MHLPPIAHLLPETRNPAKRLGRHVEHDPRSRAHVHALAPNSALQSQLWTFYGPPLNQGDVGSCTGNALAGALNCTPFVAGGKLLEEADALSLYELATRLDNIPGTYPPDDTGSSGLAVCKAAEKRGLISGYRHAFSAATALHWLSSIGPVIIGIEWFEGFDTPQGPDEELVISGSVRGGHELCIHGIDVEKRIIMGTNSWGAAWGNGGSFTISWDTFGILLSRDGDATLPYRGALP